MRNEFASKPEVSRTEAFANDQEFESMRDFVDLNK